VSRSRAAFDERTRLRLSRISIARCAGLVPLLRVCLGPSRHGQCTVPWEACAMDQCPGARDLRPGSACCLPADVAGKRGARGAAAACCSERAGCRAGRDRPLGSPGRAGVSLPGMLSGGSVLRDPHLAARSCRGEHDLTGPPRGRGEDDLGDGRPAWRPGRCGVVGAPAGIPGGPLPDLRRGMIGPVAACALAHPAAATGPAAARQPAPAVSGTGAVTVRSPARSSVAAIRAHRRS
jgi:hypothetical protein